jgi:inner membrane protein
LPSPVLHSAAGLALARLVPDASSGTGARVFAIASLILAANAPDLDFIPGILSGDARQFHHGASHSLIAAVIAGVGAGAVARWVGYRRPLRLGLLLGLAFASHLLLDMLSSYSDDRHGVALLWPLSAERTASPVPIFVGIRLDPTANTFVEGLLLQRNLVAVLWELLLIGGIWAFARRSRNHARRRAPTEAEVR